MRPAYADVCFWHKAEMGQWAAMSAFGGKADYGNFPQQMADANWKEDSQCWRSIPSLVLIHRILNF
jgi:hypothetical protein